MEFEYYCCFSCDGTKEYYKNCYSYYKDHYHQTCCNKLVANKDLQNFKEGKAEIVFTDMLKLYLEKEIKSEKGSDKE